MYIQWNYLYILKIRILQYNCVQLVKYNWFEKKILTRTWSFLVIQGKSIFSFIFLFSFFFKVHTRKLHAKALLKKIRIYQNESTAGSKLHVIYLDCVGLMPWKKCFVLVWYLTKLALGGRICMNCTSLKNKVEIYLHNVKK